jgi:hypothetical protein
MARFTFDVIRPCGKGLPSALTHQLPAVFPVAAPRPAGLGVTTMMRLVAVW